MADDPDAPVRCRRCRRPLSSGMARALHLGPRCFSRIHATDRAALVAAAGDAARGVQLKIDFPDGEAADAGPT